MAGTVTWTELVSQPDAWEHMITRLETGEGVPGIDPADYDEVLLLGSGSSYYLAIAAADWMRRRIDGPVIRALPSCEVMLDDLEIRGRKGQRRVAIGFSRSGESSELIIALKALSKAGCTTLGVGCTRKSSLMQMADHVLDLPEGHEDGLIMLRSFTCMLLAIQYLFGDADDRTALKKLPDAGRHILREQSDTAVAIANRRAFDRFVFLASGPLYPIGVEASLKIQEMSISTSEAYHSLEYRHGPKATADSDTLIALLSLSDPEYGLPLARDVKALGVTLMVTGAGAEAYAGIADLCVPVPAGMSAAQASILALMPLQIMAYATALRRGNDPDTPANLSKVVTF